MTTTHTLPIKPQPPHGQPPHGQPPHGQPPHDRPPRGQPPRAPGPPRSILGHRVWLWIATLSVLFIILHGHFLERMLRIATNGQGANLFELFLSIPGATWNRDWSHAMIIPFISVFYIYQHRQALLDTPRRVFIPGLVLFLLGLVSYAWWLGPGRNDMLSGYSMILTLFGMVLFLLGPRMIRYLWFPILFLTFAVKVSDRIWEQIAWKLQMIAAGTSTAILKLLGMLFNFDAENRGSTIDLSFYRQGEWITSDPLNVAEACSGLRMLAAFLSLGVALAFLIPRTWWQRLVMVSLAIPIAVSINIARVTILGLLHIYQPELAKGSFHTFIGMLMLIPAAGLFLLLGWVLDHIIVPHENTDNTPIKKIAKNTHTHTTSDHAQDQDAHHQPRPWSRVTLGFITGVGLTLCCAVLAVGLVSRVRPDLTAAIPDNAAIVMLIIALLALVAIAWGGRRLLRSEIAPPLPTPPLPTPPLPTPPLPVPLAALGLTLGILVVGIFGLASTVSAMKAVLIKQSVPLRKSPFWAHVPDTLGPYQQIGRDDLMSPEILEELGTEQYLSRTYLDTRMPQNMPGSVIRLHVAYYTGDADTVPHVPDRCFVAGGAAAINKSVENLILSGPQYKTRHDAQNGEEFIAYAAIAPQPVRVASLTVPATVFTFRSVQKTQQTTTQPPASNVIYFFSANGKFLPTPDHVRFQGFDLRDQYSYYCKIEVLVHLVEDPDQARELASAFLSQAMPEILACLPDWTEVKAGRWPIPDNASKNIQNTASSEPVLLSEHSQIN